ncbi:MAG: hypothetical protein IJ454_02560 [Clostridia bacterium]|nr:hypothetical protein [Clostridia bacterium]
MFAGTAFVLKQKVTALTSGQSYKLSLLMSAANQNGVTVAINYLNYDDSFSGTFTKSVQLCGNAVSKSEDCSVGFTLPPDADTAEIIITINGGTSSTVRIDNIELTESDELITNGAFENYRSDKDWFTTWNTTPNIYPKADGKVITGAATDNYAGLDASGETLTQAVLAKPQKLYRLSFDYAQSGLADTSELSPVVTLTYSGNNGEEKSVVSPVFTPAPQTEAGAAEPTWTTYEAYIVTPAVDADYAFDLVNMTLKMSAGQGENWTDGAMVYYDDISLTEADDTMIGFASGTDGSFVTVAPSAKTASCVYVQQTSDTIHKFIVAKYSKETETLAEANVYDVGKDLPAGKATRLDIPLDAYDENYRYKIFLWKDTDSTLAPIVMSKEIGR